MRYLLVTSVVYICNVSSLESVFNHERFLAEEQKNSAIDIVVNPNNINLVPLFDSGYSLPKSNNMLYSNGITAVMEANQKRVIYTIQDDDSLMVKSDKVSKNPDKYLNESGKVIDRKFKSFNVAHCERCARDYYLVVGRKEKKRYVYLKEAPYITASKHCSNHGLLAVKIELINESEDLFREDGLFLGVSHISTCQSNNTYIDETYSVNGTNVSLRKTIMQNNKPWINPDCYLIPSLKGNVVDSKLLITKLLSGDTDEDLLWGDIGVAKLHHRIVHDTGESYWVLDERCRHYESLCDIGECEYYSIAEDPKTYKFWKGKKIFDSWGQTVTYRCKSKCTSNCDSLEKNGCVFVKQECINYEDNHCTRWRAEYNCPNSTVLKNYKYEGNSAFCLDGECFDFRLTKDTDIVNAIGYLSILDAARKDLDDKSMRVFSGNSFSCDRFPLAFKDCCGCKGGWGTNLGLSKCNKDSQTLFDMRKDGRCVMIGSYCAEKTPILKTCIRRKTTFCCFGSRFAKIVQEQGRQQLGISFGTAECPNCNGLSIEELSAIDFNKLNLEGVAEDIMSDVNNLKSSHFASDDELLKIKEFIGNIQYDESTNIKQSINENIKHIIGSI